MRSESARYYVSITGLSLRTRLHAPLFWYHAVRSMRQAHRAPGNISADARTLSGVHHTRSVWTDRAAMITYLQSGAHKRALAVFPRIAHGKVVGLPMNHVPDWAEVRDIWETRGRPV